MVWHLTTTFFLTSQKVYKDLGPLWVAVLDVYCMMVLRGWLIKHSITQFMASITGWSHCQLYLLLAGFLIRTPKNESETYGISSLIR